MPETLERMRQEDPKFEDKSGLKSNFIAIYLSASFLSFGYNSLVGRVTIP